MRRLTGLPKLMLAVAGAVIVLVVAACGTTTSSSTSTTSNAGDTTGTAQAAAKYGPDHPLKIVFLLQSDTPNDGGWNESWERARKEIQKRFGDKVETSYKLSVPDTEETVNIVNGVVADGANVVIGVSYGQGQPLMKAAKAHPDVYFIQSQWKSPGLANWSGVDVAAEQGYYLAGMAAAAASKSKKVGGVVPFAVPFVLREINGFQFGIQAARSVHQGARRPDQLVVRSVQGPAGGPGRDVGRLRRRRPVPRRPLDRQRRPAQGRAVGGHGHRHQQGGAQDVPGHAGVELGRGAGHARSTAILNNQWKSTFLYADMQKDGVSMAWGDAFKTRVPADVQKKIEETEQAFKDGSKQVFTGPIKNTDGKVVVPAGKSLDVDQLEGMDFVVQGITGVNAKG
ncbi:MAG: BMP family ABC transporter substrate-binding protein [Solirubrobacteraceae bacterium]